MIITTRTTILTVTSIARDKGIGSIIRNIGEMRRMVIGEPRTSSVAMRVSSRVAELAVVAEPAVRVGLVEQVAQADQEALAALVEQVVQVAQEALAELAVQVAQEALAELAVQVAQEALAELEHVQVEAVPEHVQAEAVPELVQVEAVPELVLVEGVPELDRVVLLLRTKSVIAAHEPARGLQVTSDAEA